MRLSVHCDSLATFDEAFIGIRPLGCINCDSLSDVVIERGVAECRLNQPCLKVLHTRIY